MPIRSSSLRTDFDVIGVDFSRVALRKARAASRAVENPPQFIRADLTQPGAVPGPFDLLVDYGTLDDVKGAARLAMVATFTGLARSGSRFLLWCFYGNPDALPLVAVNGPSRASAGLRPGEEETLFGDGFEIETIARPAHTAHGFACFLMTRR